MSKQGKLSAKIRADIRKDAEHNCEGASVADTLRLLNDYDNLLAEVETLRKDAERYRWLREQTWDSAYLCVVVRPKEAVKLGHDCPSGDRLDTKIDAAMAYE